MKVTPVTSPGVIPPNGTPEASRTAKAIAAFNKGASTYDKPAPTQGQAQEHPVQNANAVSVEELSAIQANTAETLQDAPESTQEDTPTSEPQKPAEDPAISRQFAQLARQERALRAQKQQQDQAHKAKEAELAAREAALQPVKQDLSNYVSIDQLKRDAYGTLAKLGVSYDEYTQQALTHQPVNPQVQQHIEALEAKLAKLEAFNETSSKTYAEQQQAQYQAAVKQIESDVLQLVKADPTTYEVIAKTGRGAIKEVVKLIEETYNKDGILMTAEEAAQEVEDYMTEKSFKTLSQIDKIKKRMNQANASQKTSDVKTQASPKQQQMKTLTNATSSTRQLSAKERAILAFKGELK